MLRITAPVPGLSQAAFSGIKAFLSFRNAVIIAQSRGLPAWQKCQEVSISCYHISAATASFVVLEKESWVFPGHIISWGHDTVKNKIREFVLSQGIDDVGFASVSDYNSPLSPGIETIFPDAKSIVVACVKEMSHVESPNPQIAMNGRLDAQEYVRATNYKIARFLEKECGARAMSVPFSYPLDLSPQNTRSVADVSLRHAAVAAGLGAFGRHNLVIHPRLGPRVLFMAVLTNLALPSDPPVTEEICTRCNICVESCPASALDVEGRTDFEKCYMVLQPYGLGKIIGFWLEWAGKSPDERKKMFFTKDFFMTYQASFIGIHYFCFKCYSSCPAGNPPRFRPSVSRPLPGC